MGVQQPPRPVRGPPEGERSPPAGWVRAAVHSPAGSGPDPLSAGGHGSMGSGAAGHGGAGLFLGVDEDVDQGGAGGGEGAADGGLDLGGVFDPEAGGAVGAGPGGQGGGVAVLARAGAVAGGGDVANHDLDREPVLDGGQQLAHHLGEPVGPGDGDADAARVGPLGGDGVGDAGGDGGQVGREEVVTVAADVEVAGRPGRDRARVGGEDGVGGGAPV